MFASPRTGRPGVNVRWARATLSPLVRRFARHTLVPSASAIRAPITGQRGPESFRGFTLLELLIVVGIIGLLLVLIAPAFTTIKGGSDVTSAAYTIKGVLDTARTYAKANNTYTWVNFTGSIGTNVTGQVQVAIIASTYGIANRDFVTTVGKTITLSNTHIGDPGARQNNQSEFETRPLPGYQLGLNSPSQCIQFNPRGEAAVLYGAGVSPAVEVGVLPTHGNSLAVTANGAVLLGNIAAIQVGGFGGNVKIYRR